MIVMARNPIDVIPSFAGLYQLNSHSLEINESYPEDFPEYWDEWVSKLTQSMKINHEEVLGSIAKKIPTFFLRYEDLKIDPKPVLEELFCFLLDVESLDGTNVQMRIAEIT